MVPPRRLPTFQNVRRFNAWMRVARDERISLNFRHYLNAGELAAWQIGGAQNFSGKSWRRLLSRRLLRTRNQTDSGTNSADGAVGKQSACKCPSGDFAIHLNRLAAGRLSA